MKVKREVIERGGGWFFYFEIGSGFDKIQCLCMFQCCGYGEVTQLSGLFLMFFLLYANILFFLVRFWVVFLSKPWI